MTDFRKMNEAIEQHPSLLLCMQREDKTEGKNLKNKLEKDWVPCKRTKELFTQKEVKYLAI